MNDIAFSVTDTPPPITKRKGRTRTANAFRQALEESYEKGFADTDEWYEFVVEEGEDGLEKEVLRNVDRIRAAGQMEPKIGTEVRKDLATGRVAFRGVAWVPRADDNENGDGGRHAAAPALPTNDPYAEDE